MLWTAAISFWHRNSETAAHTLRQCRRGAAILLLLLLAGKLQQIDRACAVLCDKILLLCIVADCCFQLVAVARMRTVLCNSMVSMRQDAYGMLICILRLLYAYHSTLTVCFLYAYCSMLIMVRC